METLLILIPVVVAIWFACYLTQKPEIEEVYGKLKKSELSAEVMTRSHFLRTAILAVVVGFLVIPAISIFPIKLIAILSAILLFAIHIALAAWWNRTGSTALEMVPFLAIAGLMLPVTLGVSETLSLGIGPAIALCVAVFGFCIADALRRHYKLCSAESKVEEKDEKRKRIERQAKLASTTSIASGAITVLAIAAILLVPVIGANLSSDLGAKLSTTSTDPVAEADASTVAVEENDFSYIPTEKKENQQDSNYAIKVHSIDDGVIDEEEKKVIPSDLLPILEELIADHKITKADKVKARKETILNNAKHDPVWLADKAYFIAEVWDNPNNWEPLLDKDKKYLSEEGQKLYYKLEGAMETSILDLEDAPANGTNTGYYNGQNVVSEFSGIDGDLEALKIITKSGKFPRWIMDRCGNDVYPPGKIPPKIIPPGKTDNPKKDPAADPVNNGNANRGGGQNKPSDGSGDYQPEDPRTEKPTGTSNNNNQGHSDPGTVKPTTPPSPSGKTGPVHENKQDYKPDPVTNRGPVDTTKPPTKSEGDGEFTPED